MLSTLRKLWTPREAPPATRAEAARIYARPRSFTNLLPWVDYDPASRTFLLEDNESVGALFELTAPGTEARPASFLIELRDRLQLVICDAVPEEAPPWVVQLFVQDEPGLEPIAEAVARYADPSAAASDYTQHYLETLSAHLARLGRPGGLFDDHAVTGSPFRGQRRRVRLVLYRRVIGERSRTARALRSEVLNQVAERVTAALLAAGVGVRRGTGADLYAWLVPWFNAAESPAAALARIPYPGDEARPFGADFAESLLCRLPRSDESTGIWWLDGQAHRAVTVLALRRVPEIGHFTAERTVGEHTYTLLDRVPEGTVMVLTVTVRAQDLVAAHVDRLRRASTGEGAAAVLTHADAGAGLLEIAQGNKLFPVAVAFYVRGTTERELRERVNAVNALLLAQGVSPLDESGELLGLDSYVKQLPMNYTPDADETSRRSRLVFAQQAANLMPIYGRSVGTGHPGLLFYNRGAEPLVFDPLNPADREINAFGLVLGPPGSGKSALLVYVLMQLMALYRPRIFVIEKGGSFRLLGEHFAKHGLTVNQVTLEPGADVSLPPFAQATRLLDKPAPRTLESALEAGLDGDLDEEAAHDEAERDHLGEMELAARVMITGGELAEEAKLGRADRLLIRNAILLAGAGARAAGRPVLTEDVAAALRGLGDDESLGDARRARAVEMSDAMSLFCTGLAGHFFNRPGDPWPEVDVTVFEMGILANEGYEDQLTVAYMGLMQRIHELAERTQYDGRPMLVLTDEGHLITTNPLLAPYVVKIVKLWRKLGAWLWIATQNLADFPDASRKMLNLFEWWLCLSAPKEEVEQIARFRDLSEEERVLLLAARKRPGLYTEGVVLSKKLTALFRNVPPPLVMALAQTEAHEKAERAAIMRERGCSELEAAYVVAERIEASRA